MDGKRSVYSVLVGKPEEKRPLGRPRRRWADNIKMDLQQSGVRRTKDMITRKFMINKDENFGIGV